MSIQQTEDVSVFKPEVKELALNGGMSGALFLRDGSFAVTFESFDGSDFAVPLTVAHVHRQGRGASEFGLNWRLNVNRKLKLNADDTDKNTRYVYTDEFGDDRAFSEEYYYLEGNVKKPIDDKSQIEIGANGTLTYNGSQVYKNQRCGGYTLIPEVNDFKGSELIERRIDEHVALEEYILQTECELKSYVRVNAVSGAVSENSVDFGVAGNFTEENYAAFLNGVTAESEDIIIKDTDWLKWTESNRQVLINAARKNLESVKYSFKKYCRKKAELAVLQKNTPVCYLKDGSGITDGFNSDGDMVCSVDGYGNFAAIEYDESGKIVSVYDNKGRTAAFAYGGGLLKSITDNRGRKTEFLYDSSKRLTKITHPDGTYESLTYNADSNIATVAEVSGETCTLSYSGNKLTRLTVKRGSQTGSDLVISYITNGIMLLQNHESESYEFNAQKQLTKYSVTDETGKNKTQTFTYTNGGKKVTTVTTTNTSSKTSSIVREYDETGLLKSEDTGYEQITDQKVERTLIYYYYDVNNRLILKKTNNDIEVDYDPGGDSMDIYADTYIEKYTYDNYGNLTLTESYTEGEEKTSGINFEQRVYNDNGNMVKCIRWNSLDSSTKFYEEYEREEDGTVKYEKDETGAYSAMYEYVNGTNLVNSVTFANGSKLAYGRNPHNDKVTAITQSTAEGEANTNNIEYGVDGLPAKVKCGNTTLEYSYDAKGRKTEVKVNGSVQETIDYVDSYSYDENTNEYSLGVQTRKLKTGAGDIILSVFKEGKLGDGGGIRETETISVGNTVLEKNKYNEKGWLTQKEYKTESNAARYTVYTYDTYGKPTSIKTKTTPSDTTDLCAENYYYNECGNLSQRQLTGDVTQIYNYVYKNTAARELDSVSVNGYKFKPLTDVYGRNTGKEFYNGVNKVVGEYITYRKVGDHATNMPASVQYAVNGKNTENIKYKYDSCGNISEITQNGHLVARYTYDSLNRLIREDNKPLNKTVLYTYDNAGNITQRCRYAFTEYSVVPHKDNSGDHFKYEYEGDKLVSYRGAICEYNNLGNPTKYRGNECTWQYGKRLTKYGDTTFAYDTLGRRTKKVTGSTEVIYYYDNDGRIIQQKSGLKNSQQENYYQHIQFFYDTNGIAAVNFNNAMYFYRKDAQGNIIAILDSTGKLVVKYEYDAWGNNTAYYLDYIGFVNADSLNDTESGNINKAYKSYFELAKKNPFRYRGYYYDTETGLYYLQSRYYDPEVGRFISQDSVEYADPETINGLNLYAYCGNNPVMYSDPNGNSWSSFWSGVGNWFKRNWVKIVVGAGMIVAGAVVTFFTAGMGTAGLMAAGGALLASAKAVGISMLVSAGIGAVVGGLTGGWEGALNGFADGLADGFMWGGIFAGSAQIISGGFKVAANLGVATGRNGGIQLTKNLKILSPNNVKFYENGGTLLKIGKNFRLDVGAKTMLHMHMLGAEHIPIGTILASFLGGYKSLWQK